MVKSRKLKGLSIKITRASTPKRKRQKTIENIPKITKTILKETKDETLKRLTKGTIERLNSNYKGLRKNHLSWNTRFWYNGQSISAGSFYNITLAAKAYDSLVNTFIGFEKGKTKFNFIYNNSVLKILRAHRLSEDEIEDDNKPDSDDEKEPKKKLTTLIRKDFKHKTTKRKQIFGKENIV